MSHVSQKNSRRMVKTPFPSSKSTLKLRHSGHSAYFSSPSHDVPKRYGNTRRGRPLTKRKLWQLSRHRCSHARTPKRGYEWRRIRHGRQAPWAHSMMANPCHSQTSSLSDFSAECSPSESQSHPPHIIRIICRESQQPALGGLTLVKYIIERYMEVLFYLNIIALTFPWI